MVNPVAKIESAMGSLQFLTFLLDPASPPFTHYNGQYPEQLRSNISNLIEMGQQFGFGDQISAAMHSTVDGLEAQDIMDVLDGLDGDGFKEIYDNNESVRFAIQAAAEGLVSEQLNAATLETVIAEIPTLQGINFSAFNEASTSTTDSDNISIGVSRVEARHGTTSPQQTTEPTSNANILNANIGGLTEPATIERYMAAMTNEQVLGFLNSLPEEHQLQAKQMIAMEIDGETPITFTDDDGNAIDLAATSFEALIDLRGQHGLDQHVAEKQENGGFWASTVGAQFDSIVGHGRAVSDVYDGIRVAMPTAMASIISQELENNSVTSQIEGMSADDIFTILEEKRETPEGREELLTAIGENMPAIRAALKQNEDIAFMAQLLPEQASAAAGQAIRDMLHQNNWMSPIMGFFAKFIDAISGFLQNTAPNLIGDNAANSLHESFVNATDIERITIDPSSPTAQMHLANSDGATNVTEENPELAATHTPVLEAGLTR